MRAQSIVSVIAAAAVGHVAAQTTGELGDATVVSNPAGYVYEAVLPEQPFFKGSLEGNVKGSIVAMSAPDGKGVQFKVNFSNLPKEGGPFPYHIHVDPVPADGNCTKTLAHQDPFIRGEATPCDSSKPETCQTGDLSGKHGAVGVDGYEKTYVDPYLSIVEGPGSFFGNRSFVFHFANKTRISCANFKLISKPESGSTPSNCTSSAAGTGVMPTPTAQPSNTATTVPFPPNPIEVRQASGCKAFTLLFARGTTEMGTLGSVVGPSLQTNTQSALGADQVTVEGVSYPADMGGIMSESTGSGPGSVAMANQANSWLQKCPSTKLILTGYSQGGMVVHNAAKKLSGKPIVAAVTFGDPFKGQAVTGVATGKFKSFCATGDSVCSAGGCASSGGCTSTSASGHIGYGSDTKAAASFIKTAVA